MAEDRRFNEPNLSPTDAVRQHTVPRMYLAHFAIDGGVPVYDLKEDKQFDSSVNNVAVRTGFYDVLIGRRKLSTESWLAAVEGTAASIISRLVDDPAALLTLSTEDEEALSRFICAQMFRVQTFRDWDAAMREQSLDQLKQAGRAYLENTEPPEEVEAIWDAWIEKSDEWWFNEEGPYQVAETAASMLGEVQGFSNLLRAMPWRIGLADGRLSVYTSDNPVSRYPLATARRPAFVAFRYFIPLSSRLILTIGPGFDPEPRQRYRQDFTFWETSLARHVVTREASRFLIGCGPYVLPQCARECLQRIVSAKVSDAAAGLRGDLSDRERGYAAAGGGCG